MVLLLDPVPTFAQSFAKSFGGGLGQGFNEGITGRLNARADQGKNRAAQRKEITRGGRKYFEALDLPYDLKTEEALHELIDSGQARDAGDAYHILANQMRAKKQIPQNLEEEFREQGKEEKAPYNLSQVPEKWDIREGDQPTTLEGIAKAYGSGLGGGAGGPLEDIRRLLEPAGKLSNHALPLGTMLKQLGINPKSTHELTESLMGRKAQNAFERIGQESGQFGGVEGVVGTAIGGPQAGLLGTLHGSASGALYGILKEAGVNENVALGITMIASLSPVAGKRLWENLKVPKNTKAAQAVEGALETAEAETKGLSGRVSKGGQELGVEAQVAHPEEAIAHRERTAQVLSKEPEVLERALEPKPEGPGLGAKPETIEKRLAIRNAAKQEEMQAHRSMSKAREDLIEAKRDLIKAQKQKAPAEQIERLSENVKALEKSTQSLQERILDTKHRQKYFEPRKSMEDLVKQAEEASTRIRSEAFSQDTKFFEQAAKDLKNDQKYLVDEMKLLERGEVPGHIAPDTYLRVQEAYAKSYGEMLNKLKAYKNTLRTQAAHIDAETVKRVDDTIHILEQKLKALNAKTKLQRDVILSKKAIKGPAGAFTRHEIRRALGETIKENSNLQKAMFKVEEAAPSTESMGKYIEARFHKEGMPKTPEKGAEMLEKAGIDRMTQEQLKEHIQKTLDEGVKTGKSIPEMIKDIARDPKTKQAVKIGKMAYKFLKHPFIKYPLAAILAYPKAPTLYNFVKDLTIRKYANELKEAKDLRDRDMGAGADKIAEIKKRMREAGISKAYIKRAEVKAGLKAA